MKCKPLLILLFGLAIALPLKAQHVLYLGTGFSKQAIAFRTGLLFDSGLGGEVYVKTDYSRPFKSIPEMDGQRHKFSIMGGLSYELAEVLLLTGNLGYGSQGTYMVTPTQDSYGVRDLVRGVEAGFSVGFYIGDLTFVYIGWSKIMKQSTERTSQFNFGFGFGF